MSTPHDFAAQRADTQATYAQMQQDHGLPDMADVDYFLIPARKGADWRPLAKQLAKADFLCQFVEEDPPYLVATLPDQAISAEGIWIGEEIATRAALDHGFHPDGWGLET